MKAFSGVLVLSAVAAISAACDDGACSGNADPPCKRLQTAAFVGCAGKPRAEMSCDQILGVKCDAYCSDDIEECIDALHGNSSNCDSTITPCTITCVE